MGCLIFIIQEVETLQCTFYTMAQLLLWNYKLRYTGARREDARGALKLRRWKNQKHFHYCGGRPFIAHPRHNDTVRQHYGGNIKLAGFIWTTGVHREWLRRSIEQPGNVGPPALQHPVMFFWLLWLISPSQTWGGSRGETRESWLNEFHSSKHVRRIKGG